MGIFDDMLGQFGNLDELAAKFGIPAETVKAFTEELPQRLMAGGNPIEVMTELANKHGLTPELTQKMMAHFTENNPLGNLGGFAKGLFGN